MKFREIVRFELAYQARRPWPWLMFGVLLVVSFLMTRDSAVANTMYEDYIVNAPFYIALTTVVCGILFLLVAPVIAGEAAARDVATAMYPLIYTAPVGRTEYLAGRFAAALVLNALLLLAVQVGIIVGIYSPGVNPDLIAPFRVASYATAYAYISLPNAFVATTVQFALAVRSGRPMASYLGSVLLVFMGFFVASLLLFRRGLGTLLDPIGIRFVVEDVAHLWTAVEKNSRLLAFDGIILTNRLTWLAIALGVLGITWWRFRFAHRAETGWWVRWRRQGKVESPAPRRAISASAPVVVPAVVREFGMRLHVRQVLELARASFGAIARSWAGLGFLVAIPLLSIAILIDQMYATGAVLTPTTGQVLKELTGPLTTELSRWVIVPILSIFFAGEVVWREREAAVDEISDAAPVPEWVPLAGKLLGLGLLLGAFLAMLMIAGIVTQLIMGYHEFQPGLYATILFGMQLPEYLLFAVLAVVVHVVVGQKYIGHLVAVVLYIVIILAPTFGIEHNMLVYGAGPWWTYTDMRGLGPFIWPWAWFKLYWAAWALLLVVGAQLFWVRGRENRFGARLQLARQRFTGRAAGAAGVALSLIMVLGGFVFYNTNILNRYATAEDIARQKAEYERRYARYARVAQPQIATARLNADIHTSRREVDLRGSYDLVNRGIGPIDTIHVAMPRGVVTQSITFSHPAAPILVDDTLGHRIYALATPLPPGDSIRLDFEVQAVRRGFREDGADVSIVPNGTWFTQGWLPAIGYQASREILPPAERREQGLPSRPVIPSLYDVEARKHRETGIVLETVLSTDSGQTAVAPGALRRSWTENGRSFFEYGTDGPIGSEWAFASARYAVHEDRWKDVLIRVLHHPGHTTHPERMVRGIKAALDYYTVHIGAYPYRHITVLEVPGDGVGMHAEASMFTHGEGITLLRVDEAGSLDFPYAIQAHEMAHQWAVAAAPVEGAPVIGESLAWYYAIKVVEDTRGAEQLRRLMHLFRQPTLIAPIRRGEPLLRGLDPWMSYRKGPFALYAIIEYIGEQKVEGALRRLWEKHEPMTAPLATTLDLYDELKAVTPDSLRYLLHDLFEVNTSWQLDVERVGARQVADSSWEVRLDVVAKKSVIDSAGVETVLPMDELIEIGVFGDGGQGGELSNPLHLERHRIRSGAQTITVTVRRKPVLAGIDPRHLLDWDESEDDNNIEGLALPQGQ